MWDWDAEQPAPPKRQIDKRAVALSIAAAVVFAVALKVVLVAGAAPAGRAGATPSGADRAAVAGADPQELEKAADSLLEPGLFVANPDRLGLTTGETMVLRNIENELTVTPGDLSVRSDPCSGPPIIVVPLAVTAVRGTMRVDPADFRLRGTDGADVRPLAECTTGFQGATGGALAFASVAPRWLVYAPGGGEAQALWRLA